MLSVYTLREPIRVVLEREGHCLLMNAAIIFLALIVNCSLLALAMSKVRAAINFIVIVLVIAVTV